MGAIGSEPFVVMWSFLFHESRPGVVALLLGFLVGGVIGPAFHQALHGLENAAAAEICAHTPGEAAPHDHTLPDLTTDQCLLCDRDQTILHATAYISYLRGESSVYAARQAASPETPHLSLIPIRGPPVWT